MVNTVIEWLMIYFPSFFTAMASLITIIKTVKELGKIHREVVDMKDLESLKNKLSIVLQENAELKKTLREVLTKLDGVRRQ